MESFIFCAVIYIDVFNCNANSKRILDIILLPVAEFLLHELVDLFVVRTIKELVIVCHITWNVLS